MSLEVLDDVIAPNAIWSAAVSGSQMRGNRRAQNSGGYKQINVLQSRTLRRYEFGTVPLQQEGVTEQMVAARIARAWQALEGLHEVTEGGAYAFLVLDPKDSTAVHANGVVTLIDAGTHTYQLWKRYTSAGSTRTKDRKITRPRLAGFAISPAVPFTLDVETGIITIPSDPSAAAVTWAGTFYVPAHFESDNLDWDLLIAGPDGTRFIGAPNVVLTEVKE